MTEMGYCRYIIHPPPPPPMEDTFEIEGKMDSYNLLWSKFITFSSWNSPKYLELTNVLPFPTKIDKSMNFWQQIAALSMPSNQNQGQKVSWNWSPDLIYQLENSFHGGRGCRIQPEQPNTIINWNLTQILIILNRSIQSISPYKDLLKVKCILLDEVM